MFREDHAVVNGIQPAAGGDEVPPHRAVFSELIHEALRLDTLVFQETEEHEAIQSALGQLGECFAVKRWILILESSS